MPSLADLPAVQGGASETDGQAKPPVWHALLILGIVFVPLVLPLRLSAGLTPALLKNLSTREWFVPFWFQGLLIEYLAVFVVFWSLRKKGYDRRDIGLKIGANGFWALLGALTLFGCAVYAFREHTSIGARLGEYLRLGYAANRFERGLWVLVALTAGFCEEIIFRGYGLLVLNRKRIPLWLAMVVSSAAFSLMHGLPAYGGFIQNLYLFTAGIFYCVVYRLTKSLIPGIVIHTTYDFGGILLS